MGNHPCGADCMPDPDSSMRQSYGGTDNVLADLYRKSDEKRYKIVYSGDPMDHHGKDCTPRKTLNFDDADGEKFQVDRPFDISFSQSAILPGNDTQRVSANPRQPLSIVSNQQYHLVYQENWNRARENDKYLVAQRPANQFHLHQPQQWGGIGQLPQKENWR